MNRPNYGTKPRHGNGLHTDFTGATTDPAPVPGFPAPLTLLPVELLQLHRGAIAHGWQRSDHRAIAAALANHGRWAAAGLWLRMAGEVTP